MIIYTGCKQKLKEVYDEFPVPFMSIFHVFPGLFNRVDIEQVRFSYNTEYVKQFIINYTKQVNNGSNQVWQWTLIMYVKAENMYKGQKCGNHGGLFSMMFQDLGLIPWLFRPGKFEF